MQSVQKHRHVSLYTDKPLKYFGKCSKKIFTPSKCYALILSGTGKCSVWYLPWNTCVWIYLYASLDTRCQHTPKLSFGYNNEVLAEISVVHVGTTGISQDARNC